jgi:hypothetical protein
MSTRDEVTTALVDAITTNPTVEIFELTTDDGAVRKDPPVRQMTAERATRLAIRKLYEKRVPERITARRSTDDGVKRITFVAEYSAGKDASITYVVEG